MKNSPIGASPREVGHIVWRTKIPFPITRAEMERLTKKQRAWLERLAVKGTWPYGPFMRDLRSALPLIRMGLVEIVRPDAPYFPYAIITPAGRLALQDGDAKP